MAGKEAVDLFHLVVNLFKGGKTENIIDNIGTVIDQISSKIDNDIQRISININKIKESMSKLDLNEIEIDPLQKLGTYIASIYDNIDALSKNGILGERETLTYKDTIKRLFNRHKFSHKYLFNTRFITNGIQDILDQIWNKIPNNDGIKTEIKISNNNVNGVDTKSKSERAL